MGVAERTIVNQDQPNAEVHSASSAASVEYSRRLNQRRAQAAQLQRRHLWLGNIRIAVFLGIVVLSWITGKNGSPSVYWLLAPIILFIALVIAHRRVVRAMTMAKRAVAVYERGLARMEDRWAGSGETGEKFKDPLHLYAEDLDILGEGSLFQLLSTARTNMGSQCLAQWLLTHASVPEIQERQRAIIELKDKLDLREDLSVTGESE